MVNKIRGINYVLIALAFVAVTCFFAVPKYITCEWHFYEDCYLHDNAVLSRDVEVIGSDNNTYVLPSGLEVTYDYDFFNDELSMTYRDHDKVYSPDSLIGGECTPDDFTNSDEIRSAVDSCRNNYEHQKIKYANYQDGIKHWYRTPRYIAPALLLALVFGVIAFLINHKINNPVLMVIVTIVLIVIIIGCSYGAVTNILHPMTCK